MKYTQGKNPNSRNGFKRGHTFSLATRKKMSDSHKNLVIPDEIKVCQYY